MMVGVPRRGARDSCVRGAEGGLAEAVSATLDEGGILVQEE